MSSVNFEEACHKLMKLHVPEGHEVNNRVSNLNYMAINAIQ
jgi:hypothetical protein